MGRRPRRLVVSPAAAGLGVPGPWRAGQLTLALAAAEVIIGAFLFEVSYKYAYRAKRLHIRIMYPLNRINKVHKDTPIRLQANFYESA
jgi:hypothetical protein